MDRSLAQSPSPAEMHSGRADAFAVFEVGCEYAVKVCEVQSWPGDQGGEAGEACDFKEHIQQTEIDLLKAALEQCRFNQKKTAEFLGMTYHQLRGYLRKYELTDSE